MGIEYRVPTEEEWPALAHADGRGFGFTYSDERRDETRPIIDLSRFRIARDSGEIIGIVGSFAFDVTVPGGATVPMGGVTWVSVAATHRRRGVVTRLMADVHADIDSRGEPLANLGASEATIYERFGYGIATHQRTSRIDVRNAHVRDDVRPEPGSVRFMGDGEARQHLPPLWDRFRRVRAAEVTRSPELHEMIARIRSRADDGSSAAFHLRHDDGYASYRIKEEWSHGWANNELQLGEFVAVTPAAHLALWDTLVNIDLVATITSRVIPEDDPLPYLLTNYRSVRTMALTDGVWVNVRDPATVFAARTYGTDDRFVVEVADGNAPPRRFAIEGAPDGASCRPVRTKPDLIMTAATLGGLLYGGVKPSRLAAGRKITPRNVDVLRRADLFFPTAPLPYCVTPY
jgi:predicted acetyltransferase